MKSSLRIWVSSITTKIKKSFLVGFILFFLTALSLSLQSSPNTPASNEDQKSNTSVFKRVPQKLKKVVPKRIRDASRKLKKQLKEKGHPNPRVQSPQPSAMPTSLSPTTQMPEMKAPLPPPGPERFLSVVAHVMTTTWNHNIFVWLPAVSTDPNTGPTYGMMPVLVLSDQLTHRIRHLFAPSYTYNNLFGQTGTWRYYFYPTESSQFFTTASISVRKNHELKIRYENPALWEGVGYIRAETYSNVDASQRFFGIGPLSTDNDEAGYTGKSTVARLSLGINFLEAWRASVCTHYLRQRIEDTIIPNTANFATRYAGRPELETTQSITNEFRLLWDTRDIPVTPTKGSSGEIVVEKTNKGWGSDSDYFRYSIEGKQFFNWSNPKHITVAHTLFEKVNGPYIPFYEAARLGGRDSLRGYGEGRFTDRGRMVFNLEHRITAASMTMMDIQTNFEVAPFVDLGTVFPTFNSIERKNFQAVAGLGFRAAVKPNVVGDVEVGIGREGPAVFVDINYPF